MFSSPSVRHQYGGRLTSREWQELLGFRRQLLYQKSIHRDFAFENGF
jgi:hypothetical protein